MILEVMCSSTIQSHRLRRPTSAHILEPYWTKLGVCPGSCSFKDNLYCFASLLPMTNLKAIIAYLSVMQMFILLIFIVRFACTFMLMAQFGTVIVQSFIWAHGGG